MKNIFYALTTILILASSACSFAQDTQEELPYKLNLEDAAAENGAGITINSIPDELYYINVFIKNNMVTKLERYQIAQGFTYWFVDENSDVEFTLWGYNRNNTLISCDTITAHAKNGLGYTIVKDEGEIELITEGDKEYLKWNRLPQVTGNFTEEYIYIMFYDADPVQNPALYPCGIKVLDADLNATDKILEVNQKNILGFTNKDPETISKFYTVVMYSGRYITPDFAVSDDVTFSKQYVFPI